MRSKVVEIDGAPGGLLFLLLLMVPICACALLLSIATGVHDIASAIEATEAPCKE